jgi:hypothetical protein
LGRGITNNNNTNGDRHMSSGEEDLKLKVYRDLFEKIGAIVRSQKVKGQEFPKLNAGAYIKLRS